MASVVIALSAVVYFTTDKIRQRKQKKRELRAQKISEYGSVEEVEPLNATFPSHDDEDLPAYHQEGLPAYAMKDQNPACRKEKHGYAFHFRNSSRTRLI